MAAIGGNKNNVLYDPNGNPVSVINNTEAGTYELAVNLRGRVCAENSTDTNLGAGLIFTGDWQDTLDYGTVTIGIITDQDSATDGLLVQWSADSTNVAQDDKFSILADTGKVFTFGPANRYVRLVYTNGAVTQTNFNLQTILRRVAIKPSSHRVNDTIVGEDDAQLMKSVLTGLAPDGTFKNVLVTNAGNQKISIEEFESTVSSNSNTQLNTTPYESGGGEYKQDLITGGFTTVDYPHHEVHSGSHFYITGHATLGVGATLFIKLVTPDSGRWSHFTWELNSSGILTTTLDEDATGGMVGLGVTTIHANNRNANCWTGRHTGANGEATALTDSTKTWIVDGLAGYQVFNTLDGSSGIIVSNTSDTATVTALTGGTDNDFDTGDEYEINRSGMIVTPGVTACTDYIQRVDNISFGAKTGGGGVAREDEIIMKRNTVYCRSFTSGTASNIIGFKASWYEHENR